MAIEALSTKEQGIVPQCMKAVAVYIDDSEKHSRLGVDAEELQQIIVLWPNIDDQDESGIGFLATNNCMNEVCHGFRISPSEWDHWFEVPLHDVKSTYQRWLDLKGIPGGVR